MRKYSKKGLSVILAVLLLLSQHASLNISFSLFAEEDRLTEDHLAAYYDFEDASDIGKDVSGNGNRLVGNVWGYGPTQSDSVSGELELGQSIGFNKQSAMTVEGATYQQADFLDGMDVYSLSMFFKNSAVCDGGYIFSNKFWGESGIQVSTNKWADASAEGQAELWLTYRYIDASDTAQNYNKCVKFMPGTQSSEVDTAWHNFVLVVDKPNHTVQFYYDGELVDENSDMKTLVSECVEYPMAFGAMVDPQWPSAERSYDGEVDEIRIYDFAANASEAAQLSANEVSNDGDEPTAENQQILQLIAEAQKKDETMYTSDSWQVLADAITQAEGLLYSAEQNAIDQSLTTLQAAIDGLVDLESRMSVDNLLAYYSFEYEKDLGYDTSSEANHLQSGMWGNPAVSVPSGGILNGSNGVYFDGNTVMVPRARLESHPDYLDDADNYSISLFFRLDAGITDGAIYSNKNWAGEGIRLMAHKWTDASAVGQVELYFDYQYLSGDSMLKEYHDVVKFMPEASGGGVDTSWHHVAISVNKEDNKIYFYYDGEAIDVMPSESIQNLIANCSKYTMAFGGQWDDTYLNAQGAFNGWMDEIRVYDYPINETEAMDLYQNQGIPTPPAKEDDGEEDSDDLTLEATADSGLQIQFTIPRAALPEGVTMEFMDLNSGADYLVFENIINDVQNYNCFSLRLFDGSTEIISLYDYANIIVSGLEFNEDQEIYWLDAQGKLVPMNAFINGEGNLEYFANMTGSFVVCTNLSYSSNTGVDDESPDTGDEMNSVILVCMSILLAASFIGLSHKQKKRSQLY